MLVPTPADLLGIIGTTVGPTDPIALGEAEAADYVASTGDATASFAALALVNRFLPDLVGVESFSAGVNVGLDGARFGEPVRGGDRLSATATVLDATTVGEGVQVVVEVTISVDGRPEPCCVARTVSRFFP